MSLDYLNEAFKRLDLLNEETFRSDFDGINKLNDFVENDDDMDVVKVIDSNAKYEDELKDSYIGKVIIDCNVCGSHIFQDKENINVNEDGCVNCDDECPYCGETSGFTIVGEIQPFEANGTDSDSSEEEPKNSVFKDHSDPKLKESKIVKEGYYEDQRQRELDKLKEFVDSNTTGLHGSEIYGAIGQIASSFEEEVGREWKRQGKVGSDKEYEYQLFYRTKKLLKAQGLFVDYVVDEFNRLVRDEGITELKESGNSFKSHHICQGCGKPLDQCTCEVEDEGKVNEALTVDESLKESSDDFTKDLNRYEFLVKRYGHEADRETITAVSLEDAEDQLNSDGHVEYWDYLPDFNYDIDESLNESVSPSDLLELKSVSRQGRKDKLIKKLTKIMKSPEFGFKVDGGIDGWDNRTGVILRIAKYLSDNPEATPPKGYIKPGSKEYETEVSTYGDYVTTPFGNIKTDDLMDYAKKNNLIEKVTRNESHDDNESRNVIKTYKYQIRDILAKNGYDVDREDCKNYISAAAELLSYSDNPDVESWFNDTVENYPEDLEEFKKSENHLESSVDDTVKDITESVEEVSIETEDQSIKVEDDKITIENSDNEDKSEEKESEEVIVPVSDETVDNLEGIKDADTEEDEEIIDTEIEDVDEEEFDELGESYLKSVYENVESFKTTGARKKNNSIILEGSIRFKSGVKKKTGFVFEALEADKSGAFKFNGLNKHFSNDPSAFTLIGKVENKKLIPESLAYNYTVKNQLIRGVARKAR